MRGSSIPQISSGYSRGSAGNVGVASMRHPSTPFADRASQVGKPAPVFHTAQQQRVAVSQTYSAGIEDAVDCVGPVIPAENRIFGMTSEQREKWIAVPRMLIRRIAFLLRRRKKNGSQGQTLISWFVSREVEVST